MTTVIKSVCRTYLAAACSLERGILVSGFSIMVSALIVDVIGREIFGQGIFGAVTFSNYVLVYAALAGFGLTVASGKHLTPNPFGRLQADRWQSTIDRLSSLLSAIILAALGVAGVGYVLSSIHLQERSQEIDWLLWPVQCAIPIAFSISALRHLVYAIYTELKPVPAATEKELHTEAESS